MSNHIKIPFTHYVMATGHWRGSVPNVQTLPKDALSVRDPFPFPYEPMTHAAMDVLKTEDVFFEQYDPYTGHHRRLQAKVLRFDPNKDSAEIEFKDEKLIPKTMWVHTGDLRQAWGGRVVNTEKLCPKCEIPWKETMLARFPVWDCPACGAKKEDHAS